MASCGGGNRSLAKSGRAGCTGPSLLLTPSALPAYLGCFGQWRLMCPARLQDLLCLILSKLPLNEVVRTSTLSTKWRHTWTSCPNLIFDGATMCVNATTSSKERCTQVFVGNVNAVLKQCGATAVEEFQIKFPFDNLLLDHLNNWVKFAVLSRAKNLAIELEPEDFRPCKHRHVLPFELFDKQSMSRLEAIRLSMVSLKAQPNFSGFPNLTALALRMVDVSSNDLQLVLSSCFNLERLSIVMCHPDDDIRVSLPHLQHLHVAHSCINKIHFISKSLRTFVYDGFMIPLDLSESLQLGHVEMNFPSLTLEHAITELPRAMPHAQNLNLSACMTLKVFYLPEGVTKFSHLKYLQLRLYLSDQDNLLSLASFLKVSPLLEALDIHIHFRERSPASVAVNLATYTNTVKVPGNEPRARDRWLQLSGLIGKVRPSAALIVP
ncbi:hypothetical protein ZWY2020_049484 [Hordeum vulgare]|nr:hypothetical protein ZWY2020_049484 [Hordeum vulgare]